VTPLPDAAALAALRMRRTVERQRVSVDAQRRESDRNQQAILRLLDELSSLADGDLTVQSGHDRFADAEPEAVTAGSRVAGAGHMLHIERPGLVAPLVEDFLDAH